MPLSRWLGIYLLLAGCMIIAASKSEGTGTSFLNQKAEAYNRILDENNTTQHNISSSTPTNSSTTRDPISNKTGSGGEDTNGVQGGGSESGGNTENNVNDNNNNNTRPPSNAATEPDFETKESTGTLKILAFVAVLVVGGGIYARSKLSGSSRGSPARITKYHEVATDEDDEEWGWGDDGSDKVGLEMAARDGIEDIHAYKDDTNVKRRSPGDTTLFVPSPSSSPLQSNSRSLKTLTGMAPKHSPAPKPTPPTMSLSTTIPNTSSGSQGAAPLSSPAVIPNMPPQRITSLGMKAPLKPNPVIPKKEEDDIFASMGLAAKPTFSHGHNTTSSTRTTSALPSTKATMVSGQRWGQASSIPAFGTSAETSGTATSVPASHASMDDDNWDDDADLDDLLND